MQPYLDYINKRYEKYGRDVLTLGWNSKYSQENRFNMLMGIGSFRNKTILDVGCGFGDFYDLIGSFCKKYVGCDINKNLIKEAKSLHRNNKNSYFYLKNILNERIFEKFDYVIASGVFNIYDGDYYEHELYVFEMLQKMFDLCGVGVAINFLSIGAEKKTPESFYADPESIFSFIFNNITKKLVLRHDYMPHDFTIYMYRNIA